MTESFAHSTLRPALRQAAHGVDVPEDPWSGFARRERRHRRTRLIRAAMAAVVAVTLVGVQTNVVPLPGWAPGIAVAAAPTALLDAPPRGTLAGDHAWLDMLRARISTDPPVRIDTRLGGWKVGDRDRIQLIYGSDQPGHRVALVAVPLRFGLLTKEALVWYVGPAGAGAQQMRYGGHSEGMDSPVMTLMQAEPDRGGFAVVVGPADSTVMISGDPRYTPGAPWSTRTLPERTATGLGSPSCPRAASERTRRPGQPWQPGALPGRPRWRPVRRDRSHRAGDGRPGHCRPPGCPRYAAGRRQPAQLRRIGTPRQSPLCCRHDGPGAVVGQ